MIRMYEIEGTDEHLVELKVHGEESMSTIVGKNLADFKLPNGLEILAIMRNNIPLFYADDIIVADGDRLVIKADDKQAMSVLERLFQVMPLYIA